MSGQRADFTNIVSFFFVSGYHKNKIEMEAFVMKLHSCVIDVGQLLKTMKNGCKLDFWVVDSF